VITVIDYGLGNLGSIRNMLVRSGIKCTVSGDHDVIRAASRLILPGVGHFKFAMDILHERGLTSVIQGLVRDAGMPLLGICLGGQLIGRHSEEGDVAGLNLVPMDVVAFDRARLGPGEKVPHMGWAETPHAQTPLFGSVEQPARFYYVHSFHFRCDDPADEIAWAEHGYRFASGVRRGNVIGVQFHPEKSHVYGQQLLKNFAAMDFAR
jgi:glutamine amidotransferase